MDFGQLAVVEKFWKTPELVEKLVSKLDPLSTLRLIQSGVMDKDILKKGFSLKAWSRIISRSSYGGEGLLQMEDVKDLVKVLRFLELEEPSIFLLPLLDLICKSRPAIPGLWGIPSNQVKMICPSHPDPHSITIEAFLMLEELEGSFGTAEQSVGSIKKFILNEPLLSALSSRVARQREMLTSIDCNYVFCWNGAASSIEAFTTLLHAEKVDVKNLDIGGAIGRDGWHALARSLKGKPNVRLGSVYILKQDLSEVRREDIKDIWDVTGAIVVKTLPVAHSTFDWEGAWTRLEQISSMTEDEFNAESRQLEQEAEEGSGEDGEGEGEDDEEDQIEDQEHDGEEGDEDV